MKNHKRIPSMKLWHFLFLFGFPLSWGQDSEVSNTISKANELFNSKETVVSEMEYRKALSVNPNRIEALYNLGNNHYREGDFDEAAQRYFETQKKTSNRSERHQAFHNIGNVSMEQKDYGQAVEAYKNALRNNPADEETRYNYALAKKMLEKEKQQQDQDQKNKDQNKDQKNKDQDSKNDKNEDKEDQSDKKDEGDESDDQGEQDKKDNKDKREEGNDSKDNPEDKKNEKPEKKQPSQPKEGQLSPQQVKSLLEAMNNQEKKVQDKIKAQKAKGTPVKGKKDW